MGRCPDVSTSHAGSPRDHRLRPRGGLPPGARPAAERAAAIRPGDPGATCGSGDRRGPAPDRVRVARRRGRRGRGGDPRLQQADARPRHSVERSRRAGHDRPGATGEMALGAPARKLRRRAGRDDHLQRPFARRRHPGHAGDDPQRRLLRPRDRRRRDRRGLDRDRGRRRAPSSPRRAARADRARRARRRARCRRRRRRQQRPRKAGPCRGHPLRRRRGLAPARLLSTTNSGETELSRLTA